MSAFLKLDIFRKLPKDLTEPTFCGGVGKYHQTPRTLSYLCVCNLLGSLGHLCNPAGDPDLHRGEIVRLPLGCESDLYLIFALVRQIPYQH